MQARRIRLRVRWRPTALNTKFYLKPIPEIVQAHFYLIYSYLALHTMLSSAIKNQNPKLPEGFRIQPPVKRKWACPWQCLVPNFRTPHRGPVTDRTPKTQCTSRLSGIGIQFDSSLKCQTPGCAYCPNWKVHPR
jgi:hypothetical protein